MSLTEIQKREPVACPNCGVTFEVPTLHQATVGEMLTTLGGVAVFAGGALALVMKAGWLRTLAFVATLLGLVLIGALFVALRHFC